MVNSIVGQGTYGCVIKPALKCKTSKVKHGDKIYKNKVSKIMFDEDANDELEEMKLLSSMPDIGKYAVSTPKLCKPELDKQFDNIVKKCNKTTVNVNKYFIDDKKRLSQLLLEDGGINLEEATQVLFDKVVDDYEAKVFYTSLLNLFEGLIFFNKNKVIHFDIKPMNLVYNFDTGISKFIDFGLMKTHEKVVKEYSNNTAWYAIRHFNFPPENEYGLKSLFYLAVPAEKYRDHFKTYDSFLQKLIKTFDSWGLCVALYNVFNYAKIKDTKNRTFLNESIELFLTFASDNINNRDDRLNLLRDSYTKLLKDYNIYTLKKQSQYVSPKIKKQVDSIKNKNMDDNVLKANCDIKNKDLNPLTKRCLKKCEDGFLRNEKNRCIKIKKPKINTTTTKKKPKVNTTTTKKKSTGNREVASLHQIKQWNDIEKKCLKQNKDYNRLTKRCNKLCKNNQIRNENFKCVTNK
tara:strand:+ start:6753 stop:8138 length:1386 start_codon:yes stop_codon:yes gene_type:complete